ARVRRFEVGHEAGFGGAVGCEATRAHEDVRAVTGAQDVDLFEFEGSVGQNELQVEPARQERARDAVTGERPAGDVEQTARSVRCLTELVRVAQLERGFEHEFTESRRGKPFGGAASPRGVWYYGGRFV